VDEVVGVVETVSGVSAVIQGHAGMMPFFAHLLAALMPEMYRICGKEKMIEGRIDDTQVMTNT
jgi:hypothetical protein